MHDTIKKTIIDFLVTLYLKGCA